MVIFLDESSFLEPFNPNLQLQVKGFYVPPEPPSHYDETGKPTYPGEDESFTVEEVHLYHKKKDERVDLTPIIEELEKEVIEREVLDFLHSTHLFTP